MTIKQKQHILAFLGYYQGDIDGIWGSLSRSATENLQRRRGLAVDGVFGPLTEAAARQAVADGEETFRFSREDFRCKCGGKYCNGYPAEMDEKLVSIAEEAIAHFAQPFDPARDLVSALRCPTHNANEGGVAGSRHLRGKAMDLRIPNITAQTLLAYLKTRPIRYAYAITDTNVHFDVE